MTNSVCLAIPDLGDTPSAEIIEILVKVGDNISKDQPLIVLEGEKASMEIPAEQGGIITEIVVAIGDKVSCGDDFIKIMASGNQVNPSDDHDAGSSKAVSMDIDLELPDFAKSKSQESPVFDQALVEYARLYAGPAVRRLAQELDINLDKITPTGRKARILPEDLYKYIKDRMSGGGGLGFELAQPQIDYSKYGQTELEDLSKINVATGRQMQKAYLLIPHVTQYNYADITGVEESRRSLKSKAKEAGVKLTLLPIITKVLISCLQKFPRFNSSLSNVEGKLVLKQYYHIGIAMDSPQGLVVPVIKDADQKTIKEIALEIVRLHELAKNGKLKLTDMQGGCMTISSLGGVGGEFFSPIINSPEVAILGLSRSSYKPVWLDGEFKARLQLPTSLSYDHRVIDGVLGAQFSEYFNEQMASAAKHLLAEFGD